MINLFRRLLTPTKWRKNTDVPADSLQIHVVDSAGMPVKGAYAGNMVTSAPEEDSRDGSLPEERLGGVPVSHCSGRTHVLRFLRKCKLPQTNEGGFVNIPQESLVISHLRWQPDRLEMICVIQPDRNIGGLACCRLDNLGSIAELTLEPLCHVKGEITCTDETFLRYLPHVKTHAYWSRLLPVSEGGCDGQIDMILPSGKYTLSTRILIEGDDGVTKSLQCLKKVRIPKGAILSM